MSDWTDVPLFHIDVPCSGEGEALPEQRRVESSTSLSITDKERARFRKNIVKSPSCWFWIGAISTPDGYGRFTWQRGGKQRTVLARRFALELEGFSTVGVIAEHFCNEPLCVRVDEHHVFASTQSDNIRYAVTLGRHRGNRRTIAHGLLPAERSMRIRQALQHGWDEERFYSAISPGPLDQPTLF